MGLLVAGVGCLQYVLERGESDDWFSSRAIVINTILAVTCLPAFVFWELKVPNPIINVRLFKERIVAVGVMLMASVGFFLYGAVFLLPIFLGRTYHFTATQTGLLFIPGSILTALMMPVIGKQMTSGRNPKTLIFISLVCLELCMYVMTTFSPLSSKGDILLSLYVRGFALAFLFVPINSSILSQFTGANLGQVSGLLNLFRQLGGSAGVALVATLLSTRSQQNFVDLTSKVSLLNPTTQFTYYPLAKGLGQKMTENMGMATGHEAALRAIGGRIQNQVFMLSFNQLIWTMMIIFSLAFIPWYFMELKRKVTGPIDSH